MQAFIMAKSQDEMRLTCMGKDENFKFSRENERERKREKENAT